MTAAEFRALIGDESCVYNPKVDAALEAAAQQAERWEALRTWTAANPFGVTEDVLGTFITLHPDGDMDAVISEAFRQVRSDLAAKMSDLERGTR